MSEAEDNEPLTSETRTALLRLYTVVNVFLSLHPRMTMQTAMAFACVAEKEEQTVAELAAKCEVSPALMSRILRNLGNVNRHNRAGLGLVVLVQRVYGDRRERRVVLTERGVRAAELISIRLFGEAPSKIEPRPKSPLV